VGVASAQVQVGTPGASIGGQVQCTVLPSSTPALRAEGMTELLGDIVLSCTGGSPLVAGAAVNTANIVVTLGQVPVTSRILGNGGSEALLLIDDPGNPVDQGPGTLLPQVPCSNVVGSTATVNACTALGFQAAYQAAGNTGAYEACPVASYVTATGVCSSIPNVFQGVIANTYQVVFNGVPILAPATSGYARYFRITNLRANVSTLGGPGLATLATVNAFISISGTNPIGFLSSPSVQLGQVQTGLTGSIRTAANGSPGTIPSLQYLQCVTQGSTPQAGAVLRYQELFATAFKVRNTPTGVANTTGSSITQPIPGQPYAGTESGLEVSIPGSGITTAGLADFGTRLRAVFNNIPAGVSVWVTVSNVTTGTALSSAATVGTGSSLFSFGGVLAGTTPVGTAVLVASETSPDFNGGLALINPSTFLNSGTLGLYNVPVTNGVGEAVWEVVNENPIANDTLDFGVYFSYVANQSTNTPPVGTGTVDMSYAPAPTTTGLPPTFTASAGGVASSTLPIPRFADFGSVPSSNKIITISLCQTTILLPFITNENGLETGISVANTTTDTFGTTPQAGTCAMTFYGDSAGPTTATAPCTAAGSCLGGASIASGKVFAATLTSILGSSFQGYAIITCNFQYAHAFTFISDTHATQIAMGYLGLVFDGGGNIVRGGSAEAMAN